MPAAVRFAFIERIQQDFPPVAFADLTLLAKDIETRRRGQGIRLENVADLMLYSPDGTARPRRGVKIVTQLLDGGDDRVMGYAYLDHHNAEVLQHALLKVRTDKPQPARRTATKRKAA